MVLIQEKILPAPTETISLELDTKRLGEYRLASIEEIDPRLIESITIVSDGNRLFAHGQPDEKMLSADRRFELALRERDAALVLEFYNHLEKPESRIASTELASGR